IVDVEVVIILGIGDRRLQALAHILGDALARELEIGERGRDLLAADERGQEIELLRRNPQHAGDPRPLLLREAPPVRALTPGFGLTRWRPAAPTAPAPGLSSCALPCDRPSVRRTGGSARTRRTCGRPFLP